MELFVIGSENAEVVHIARGYIDADPEVYKNPMQEDDVRRHVDAVCQVFTNAEEEQNVRGYVDADPEVYKNPLQEHELRFVSSIVYVRERTMYVRERVRFTSVSAIVLKNASVLDHLCAITMIN